MNVNYIHTSPRWHFPGSEAVQKEISQLFNETNGAITNIYPRHVFSGYRPIVTVGYEFLRKLRRLENETDVNHFFAPALMNYSFLSFLRNPIVYTITAPVEFTDTLPPLRLLKKLTEIVTSDENSASILATKTGNHVRWIEPFVDFECNDTINFLPESPIIILMASAPWTKQQIKTKGIELILKTMLVCKEIHFKLLLRGRFHRVISQIVRDYGLTERVEILDSKVNMQQMFNKCHATILITSNAKILKSHPHSLIESLICKKPIILSKNIPLSNKIENSKYAIALNQWNVESLNQCFHQLKKLIDRSDQSFHLAPSNIYNQNMIQDYKNLYHSIL